MLHRFRLRETEMPVSSSNYRWSATAHDWKHLKSNENFFFFQWQSRLKRLKLLKQGSTIRIAQWKRLGPVDGTVTCRSGQCCIFTKVDQLCVFKPCQLIFKRKQTRKYPRLSVRYSTRLAFWHNSMCLCPFKLREMWKYSRAERGGAQKVMSHIVRITVIIRVLRFSP